MTELIVLPQTWLLPVSMLIPLIVAAASKAEAPSSVRQAIAIMSAIAVAILEQVTAASFTLEGLLVSAVLAFLTQLGAYLGTNRILDVLQSSPPVKEGAGVRSRR